MYQERQNAFKKAEVAAKLEQVGIPKEGVDCFIRSWTVKGFERPNGKAEWHFEPDEGRSCYSVPDVIAWFRSQFIGDKARGKAAGGLWTLRKQSQDGDTGSHPSDGEGLWAEPNKAGPDENAPPVRSGGLSASGRQQDGGDGAAAEYEDHVDANGSHGAKRSNREDGLAPQPVCLTEAEANQLGALCLLSCWLMHGYRKAEALVVGAAAKAWADGPLAEQRLPHAQLEECRGSGPSKVEAKVEAKAQERPAKGKVRCSGRSKAAGPTALTGALAAGPAEPHTPTEPQPVGVEQPADAAVAAAAASREVASALAATSAEPMRAETPVGSSSAAPQARGQKRKAMDSRAKESDPEAEEFDARKHVVRNMTVLLRTNDDSDSGWDKVWSLARVNRYNKSTGMMSVTWLKPVSLEEFWATRWQDWTVEMKDKKGKRYEGVWSSQRVDIDTVQWGTHLRPDGYFREEDRETLCFEVKRMEAAAGVS
ncbi:g8950 [Coccomyxa elongata]